MSKLRKPFQSYDDVDKSIHIYYSKYVSVSKDEIAGSSFFYFLNKDLNVMKENNIYTFDINDKSLQFNEDGIYKHNITVDFGKTGNAVLILDITNDNNASLRSDLLKVKELNSYDEINLNMDIEHKRNDKVKIRIKNLLSSPISLDIYKISWQIKKIN